MGNQQIGKEDRTKGLDSSNSMNFTQAEASDMNLRDKRADFLHPVQNIFFHF